jgi:hypothetical protein
MSEDHTGRTGEASVDDAVLERAAGQFGVDAAAVADALVVLHADLIGRHSEFEDHDYVTVDDTRAYRVPAAVWDDLRSGFDLEDDVADAVAFAHTEQARLAFDDAIGADERFADDERGVVIGVDTAEEF